ncbi:right-handed parallel beta-helix repeat-containing protein, partial [Microbacterium sp. MYb40]|uniref:right-handed parallel beta-helix repeat-containing protein n=1 Tax=Microbacterium sp. MYb40 TaxID=1848687 RepID=UPI0015E32025
GVVECFTPASVRVPSMRTASVLVPPVTPEGVRGEPGAKAPGTLAYEAPATAIYVGPAGFDGAAGTKNSPVKTIAAALRVVPNGGTIVLRGGTYHEEIVVPAQKRVTIQPAPNEAVWLDGAKPVTGWKASGNTWAVDGWNVALDASPTYTKGAPDNTQAEWRFVDPDHPMAAHPDEVWVAGVQLREVASAAQVTDGTFFVDGSAKRLVIGSNPTGKSVEASVLTQALSIRSAGTEVRGIGVRRYATSVPQMGTVIAAAPNVSLTDVTIRDNSTTGFYSWAPATTLTRVSLIGNGLLGGGASQADGLKVSQMLSVGNNMEEFNHSPVSGAFKVTRTRGVTVTDSAFTGNYGRGPWFDESVLDIAFTGNDVIGNTGHGVMVELSERAVIADNVIARNGDFGLFVLNSGSVKIWNNTFVGNANRNISIGMDSRRASDPNTPGHDPRTRYAPQASWIVRNVVMSNNVMAESAGNCLVCVQDFSLQYTGSQMVSSVNGNLYHRTSPGTPRWFSAWSRGATSRDPAVADTLAAFTAATGQDRRSRFVEGATVVDGAYGLLPAYAAGQASVAVPVPSDIASVSRLPGSSTTLGALPR